MDPSCCNTGTLPPTCCNCPIVAAGDSMYVFSGHSGKETTNRYVSDAIRCFFRIGHPRQPIRFSFHNYECALAFYVGGIHVLRQSVVIIYKSISYHSRMRGRDNSRHEQQFGRGARASNSTEGLNCCRRNVSCPATPTPRARSLFKFHVATREWSVVRPLHEVGARRPRRARQLRQAMPSFLGS